MSATIPSSAAVGRRLDEEPGGLVGVAPSREQVGEVDPRVRHPRTAAVRIVALDRESEVPDRVVVTAKQHCELPDRARKGPGRSPPPR